MKKSLRRKLLLSGLAMGVAAISLGSTTYAWFSNIDSVNAENAVINVDVPTSLLLHGSDTVPGTTGWVANLPLVDITSGADDTIVDEGSLVNPVQKVTGTEGTLPTFKELTEDAKKNGVTEDGKVNGKYDAVDAELEDSKGDVFNDIFWIKYDDKAANSATVHPTIDFSSAGEALDAAVVFELYESTDGTTWTLVGTTTMDNPSITWNDFTLQGQQKKAFAVFLYVKGNDGNCKNANVQALADYQVSINFKKVTA